VLSPDGDRSPVVGLPKKTKAALDISTCTAFNCWGVGRTDKGGCHVNPAPYTWHLASPFVFVPNPPCARQYRRLVSGAASGSAVLLATPAPHCTSHIPRLSPRFCWGPSEPE